jgi:hypothetical protein
MRETPGAAAQAVGLYGRLIWRWEHRLHLRGGDRVVRPFEWGLDWLGLSDPAELSAYAGRAVEASDEFFRYAPVSDYQFDGQWLRFSSPLPSPYPENNVVHARYFPARKAGGRAVLVLPQWNADEQGHMGLCRLLNVFGLSALRLSMPYHDRRKPPELERADYAVSASVGRTLHANRQAVMDTRAALDWLAARGYQRLGVLGTSLGSCTAFIAAVHDPRVTAGAFNHVSTHFADVVWRGLSTAHVRAGLEGHVALDDLRRFWAPISPAAYVDRLAARTAQLGPLRTLIVWARYDLSFPPDLSNQFIGMLRERGLPWREMRLPCGHYTTGVNPFKWMDGLGICRFLAGNL